MRGLKKFIDGECEKFILDKEYFLKERDGVPLLCKSDDKWHGVEGDR